MPESDNDSRLHRGGVLMNPMLGARGAIPWMPASAVSSVDMLAPLVVSDPATAQDIKIEIVRQDIHDLTAIRDGNLPDHVSIPSGEKPLALARSYAGAELTDRQNKAAWSTSRIGWAMSLIGIALGIGLGAWLVS